MGRVSDAMRRAAHETGRSDQPVEDSPFTVGEDEAAAHTPPPPAAEEPQEAQYLPPTTHLRRREEHLMPIRVNQKAADGEIRFIDAVGALARRRWLIVGILAASLASAAAYNRFAPRV